MSPASPPAGLPSADPALVVIAALSRRSQPTMRWALSVAAQVLFPSPDLAGAPWEMLTRAHLLGLRSRLVDRYAAGSVNLILRAVKSVLREAWRMDLLQEDAYRRLIDVHGVLGSTEPPGRALSRAEVLKLFSARPRRLIDLRDRALLATLYGTGMRKSEAIQLEWEDIDPDDGRILVRHGKGNRQRRCFPSAFAIEALVEWGAEDPLDGPWPFHRIADRAHLSPRAVGIICRNRAAEAGIAPFSPHDLRRTAITHLLDAGVDPMTVRNYAGHLSLQMTARYDRRGADALRAAGALLEIQSK